MLRKVGQRYNKKNLKVTVKNRDGSIVVWAFFSGAGLGKIV